MALWCPTQAQGEDFRVSDPSTGRRLLAGLSSDQGLAFRVKTMDCRCDAVCIRYVEVPNKITYFGNGWKCTHES